MVVAALEVIVVADGKMLLQLMSNVRFLMKRIAPYSNSKILKLL